MSFLEITNTGIRYLMTWSQTLVCCTFVYHPRTVRISKHFPGGGFVCRHDRFCLFVLLFLVVYYNYCSSGSTWASLCKYNLPDG